MLNDLLFVLKHIKSIVEQHQLIDLYQNFASTLQQIASASTPELQTQFKGHKEKIKQVQELLEPKGWSYSQIQIFKKFGAEDVIGKKGYDRFLHTLAENSTNAPGAIQELDAQRQEISKLYTNTNNILSSLGNLAQEMQVEKDEAVIQVVFDEEVKIDTFIDLKNQSEDWKEIIRAYSLLTKEAPERTRIIATSKSSPYMIWLATARFMGETLCATITPFVELYKKVLEAKQHALVLEDMKVDIDGKKFELIKNIEEFERKRIVEIVTNIADINSNGKLSQADKNEAKTALLKAGPKLYLFITKGGKIDVSTPNEDGKVINNFTLESAYQETNLLKVKVQKLLTTRVEKGQDQQKTQESQNTIQKEEFKKTAKDKSQDKK